MSEDIKTPDMYVENEVLMKDLGAHLEALVVRLMGYNELREKQNDPIYERSKEPFNLFEALDWLKKSEDDFTQSETDLENYKIISGRLKEIAKALDVFAKSEVSSQKLRRKENDRLYENLKHYRKS